MPKTEYTLHRMSASDAPLTIDWMVHEYGFARAEVEQWVATLEFDWSLSVKAVDSHGQTIGLLNMSRYRIEKEAESMPTEAPQLLATMNALRYTAVFSFIVSPQYRGTPLNQRMIESILPELRQRYDFVFIPVMHRLKTHQYWQRWGAREFFRDAQCVYYQLPLH